MKKIAIIGAGGFGREVKMLIDQINNSQKQYDIIGFYDDKYFDGEINGLPYLGVINDLNKVKDNLSIALSIADPRTKRDIINHINNKRIEFPNLIHPNVIIGADAVILGKGNIICASVILTVNITIKNFVILNLACTVGHDTTIGSYSSLMPNVNISGNVDIMEGIYIGTGAKISNLLQIGEYTIIGAGAVVGKSIPANCTAVGIPAKPIKFHN